MREKRNKELTTPLYSVDEEVYYFDGEICKSTVSSIERGVYQWCYNLKNDEFKSEYELFNSIEECAEKAKEDTDNTFYFDVVNSSKTIHVNGWHNGVYLYDKMILLQYPAEEEFNCFFEGQGKHLFISYVYGLKDTGGIDYDNLLSDNHNEYLKDKLSYHLDRLAYEVELELKK